MHTVPTQRRNEIIYEIEQKEAHEAVVTVKALTRVLAWLTIAIAALTVVLVIKEFI